jgi:hypothetical protein
VRYDVENRNGLRESQPVAQGELVAWECPERMTGEEFADMQSLRWESPLPVKWMVTRDSDVDKPEYFDTEQDARANACLGVVDTHIHPLYLAPPSHAQGVAAGIEMAAKVADSYKHYHEGYNGGGPDAAMYHAKETDAGKAIAAAIRALNPQDLVCVPVDALKWLMGCGDDFERPDDAKGNYWWRSEFRKRAGISDETVNQWAIAAAQKGE